MYFYLSTECVYFCQLWLFFVDALFNFHIRFWKKGGKMFVSYWTPYICYLKKQKEKKSSTVKAHSIDSHEQVCFANLSTIEDVLSFHSSICYFVPYCLPHFVFIVIDQSSVNVSVARFDRNFDRFICSSFRSLSKKKEVLQVMYSIK